MREWGFLQGLRVEMRHASSPIASGFQRQQESAVVRATEKEEAILVVAIIATEIQVGFLVAPVEMLWTIFSIRSYSVRAW